MKSRPAGSTSQPGPTADADADADADGYRVVAIGALREPNVRRFGRAGVGLIVAALAGALVVLLTQGASSAPQAAPKLTFTVAATTGVRLVDIVWKGTRFLYVENTTNRVVAAGPDGKVTGLFAQMPEVVEETRCVLSPGRHGFAAGDVFCHSPDNRIYRITADGSTIVFATLPEAGVSDGALTADRVGRFGYRLVAATGSSLTSGGSVFAIDARGAVQKVASYPGPGGAENVVIAPAGFGSQAGSALITLDGGKTTGSLVAVSRKGTVATIARFPDGLNPIAVIPPRLRLAGAPAAGLYLTDTFPGTVLRAAASQFEGHAGEVIVGSEQRGLIWLVAPRGKGFRTLLLPTNLTAPGYNLEGATFVP